MQLLVKSIFVALALIVLSAPNAHAVLGHDNGGRTWNVFGPDKSGAYGGAQGIGGLDNEVDQSGGFVNTPVTDYFGDAVGETFTQILGPGAYAYESYSYGATMGGYGYLPGSGYNDLTSEWRGKYVDWTGFIYQGARYYDYQSGRFLSADPLGNAGSMDLYSYCNGDPVNGLDPDGRLGKGLFEAGGGSGSDYDSFFGNDNQGVSTGVSEPNWGVVDGPGGISDGPGESEAEQTSQDLNMIPVFGAFKMLAQGITGYDFVTGQYVSDSEQISDAVFGVAGLVPGAALEDSVAADSFDSSLGTTFSTNVQRTQQTLAADGAPALAKPIFCFPPGTKVLMADGSTKAIEDVQEGDNVASDDISGAGKRIDKPVTQLHKNWTKRLIHISISSTGNGKVDGELQATGEHPIWTQNRGWINAKDLVAGDRLLAPTGKEPVVVSAISVPTVTATYNLSIEGTHAFFVMAGKTPVLVHNTPDIEEHHSWPKYLGGPEDQTLVPLTEEQHLAYHNFLDDAGLPKNLGAAYYQEVWALDPAQKIEDMRTFRDATQAFDETYGTNLLGAAKAEGAPIPCD